MRSLCFGLICTALLASPFGALAESASTTPLPPAVSAETRQFDFWLGEWNVTTLDGKPAGTNRIESVAGGRALLENWVGDPAAGNGMGKSLNAWNADKKQWQQFWVGSGGGVLELAGSLVGPSMVLRGDHEVGGRRTLERITWTPQADDSVRQLWEQSTDGGQTWSVAFDGHYAKKMPKAAASGAGGGGGSGGTLRWMYFLFM